MQLNNNMDTTAAVGYLSEPDGRKGLTMKYIASCSFGRDSLAMLLRIMDAGWPLDGVLYVELGPEFDCVKELARKMGRVLAERNIPFRILRPEMPFEQMMLEKPVRKRDGSIQNGLKWCGGPCRWGTALKRELLNAAYRELFGNEPIVEYVGLCADEKDRARINRDRNGSHVKLYPLIEWGMGASDCHRYCLERGWGWNEYGKDGKEYELYDILDRVSCKFCVNNNLRELRNIYHFLPHVWDELKELQAKTGMPYKKGVSVDEFEERFKDEDRQLSLLDLFS